MTQSRTISVIPKSIASNGIGNFREKESYNAGLSSHMRLTTVPEIESTESYYFDVHIIVVATGFHLLKDVQFQLLAKGRNCPSMSRAIAHPVVVMVTVHWPPLFTF